MDNSQQKLLPESTVVPKPKKAGIPFRFVIVFLIGAMTYAVISGIYLINRPPVDDTTGTTKTPSQQTAQTPLPVTTPVVDDNTKISESELKKYVTPVDCTTLKSYNTLVSLVNLGAILSIDLYDGMTTKAINTTQYLLWKKLPIVVDYKCNVIKITDIQKGDRVNIYVDKTVTTKEAVKDIKLIQKANL